MSTSLARLGLASALFATSPVALAHAQDHRHSARMIRVERYQGDRGPEEIERFSRTLKLPPNGELELANVAGDITITASAGREVRLDVTKRARAGSRGEAKRHLALVDVVIREMGSRAEVRAHYGRGERHVRASVDFDVTVPAGLQVNVKSISGNVRVSNLKGELRAETVSGNLYVASASRLSAAKSISGDVEITSAASELGLTASTVSGRLMAKGIKTRNLDLGTVSGDLEIHDATCDRANIRSISGNLEYLGPLLQGGRYEMKSHSGDVRLLLTKATGFELDASSISGTIRSDFPITVRGGSQDPSSRRRRVPQTIQGVHGDGGAILIVMSFSGSITIAKR